MEATSLFRTLDMAVLPSFGSARRSSSNSLSDFYRRRLAPTGHCLHGFRGSNSSSSSSSSSSSIIVVSCSETPDDDRKPAISSDWRSFRARLVAGERTELLAAGSDVPTSAAAAAPPPVLGDRWAHPLHEPERGCLLVATEKLDGVHIFERTVILLLSSGPLGPAGVILNRPSLMSIKETRSTDLDVAGTFSDRPLSFGGPLEGGVFLLKAADADADSDEDGVFEEVMRGVYYGTKESVGCAAEMVKRGAAGVGDFRFFDGYCGWEREQLREEIRAGYWSVAACSASIVGMAGASAGVGLWEEVLGLVGEKKLF
ncbi:uncharacterized protein M6B38_365410 [Iris pallida]|uniref:Uncharacterized protein n=1 Tax=Iris pallida TaxID=29817 RepID=A0AAX6GHW4_IRIPA|nr:uncharacterized protein M6B38_365410 [Iris pallida]